MFSPISELYKVIAGAKLTVEDYINTMMRFGILGLVIMKRFCRGSRGEGKATKKLPELNIVKTN